MTPDTDVLLLAALLHVVYADGLVAETVVRCSARSRTATGTGHLAWVRHEPVGVVGAITPFDFPLNLAAHKVGPAIAAGCACVLKPADKWVRAERCRSAARLIPLMVMVGWADKWLAGKAGPPVLYRHHACGEISHVDLHCAHCREPMHAVDVELLPDPAPRWEHSRHDDVVTVRPRIEEARRR